MRFESIMVESGVKGWKLIEKLELVRSANEVFGSENVHRLSLRSRSQYLRILEKALHEAQPDCLVVCPRTMDVKTSTESEVLGASIQRLCEETKTVPIVQLTDWESPFHRKFSDLVTEKTGLISLTIDPGLVRHKFAHARVFGPQLMAFSMGTFLRLRDENSRLHKHTKPIRRFILPGSFYEPRKTILENLNSLLDASDISVQYISKFRGTSLRPEEAYWQNLLRSELTFITGAPARDTLYGNKSILHAEWRITEAIACGNLVVAPVIEGLDSFFIPDVHYVAYRDISEAARKISVYSRDPRARRSIADEGNRRLEEIIREGGYWSFVQSRLEH